MGERDRRRMTCGVLAAELRPAEVNVTMLLAYVRRTAMQAGFEDGAIAQDQARETTDEAFSIVRASPPLRRRGGVLIVDPSADAHAPAHLDRPLLRAVVLSQKWAQALASGEVSSAREIARRHGLCPLYVGKLLPLAFLAPDLAAAILAGRQPRGLSISALLAEPLPLAWREQRARFRDAG